MLNHSKLIQLTNNTLHWYFDGGHKYNNLKFDKIANTNPKHSDEMWAQLMIDAISSFHDGLEGRIEDDNYRVAQHEVELYKKAVNLVGDEAFNIIAFLVSAADIMVKRPIEMFMRLFSEEDLIKNETDTGVYPQAMAIIGNESQIWNNQEAVFKAYKDLQPIARTPGISQELMNFISHIAAMFMVRADELTRPSDSMAIGTGGMSGRGMPTGITFQGNRKISMVDLDELAQLESELLGM